MRIKGKFRVARLNYQARLGRDVTIDEVAQQVGISRQTLSDLERGVSMPRWGTLEKLCALYGVGPDELLETEEESMLRPCSVMG